MTKSEEISTDLVFYGAKETHHVLSFFSNENDHRCDGDGMARMVMTMVIGDGDGKSVLDLDDIFFCGSLRPPRDRGSRSVMKDAPFIIL